MLFIHLRNQTHRSILYEKIHSHTLILQGRERRDVERGTINLRD